MFINKKSVYVHVPKTGGSHIISLLSSLTDGSEIGDKHGAATAGHIKSDRYIVSSIRNPWDWYLSLWSYGVHGHGAMMKRLTLTKNKRFSNILKKNILRPGKYLELISLFRYWLSSDIDKWRSVYDKSENIDSFRKWLRMIHDPANSHHLKEGYNDTAINDFAGLLTYRYLVLSCTNIEKLSDPKIFTDYSDLARFENENCYIDYFIRQESLEDNLCEFLEEYHQRPISSNERMSIFEKKNTNTSKRSFKILEYYDEESVNLVYNRDRLIVDKFDYSPPFLTEHIIENSQVPKTMIA